MSTGERVAAQYRGVATDQLRQLRRLMRNQRRQAAVNIVITERQDAYQTAFDAAQVVLDATGGAEAPELHARAVATSMRHAAANEWLDAERAMGVADAFWDYIRERSDT